MEGNIERECSALGGLFQQIINDMKNGAPLWEDLIAKATKLHTCLKATIQAIAAYLDAFQKIADAATNTRGATKEIGTALTRICLRHKAVEARMKTFTSAIMDCLVIPLQEKLEDWKKAVINLDKEHAKEYKRARAELKKRSTDTLRLQKKARKGKNGELQRRVESCLQDVNERRQLLEETEKKAVREALVEERSRYCLLVAFLKPVVDEEVAMLSELSHLQEVVDQIQKHTADPYTLPPASEQVIADLKGSDSNWSFQTPPSSPSSLGSRKSSMCSISSLNSSSSGSSKSHHSPSHHYWHRSLSQVSNASEQSSSGSNPSTPSAPFVSASSTSTLPTTTATWPNLQETLQFERAATAIMNDRPHTISSAYERGHQRPPLTVYTFQAPEASHSQPVSPVSALGVAAATSTTATTDDGSVQLRQSVNKQQQQQQPVYARPPIPQRCSSLERPSRPTTASPKMSIPSASTQAGIAKAAAAIAAGRSVHLKTDPPKIILPGTQQSASKEPSQPMYVNMHELASMAASKAQEMNFPPPPPELTNPPTETPDKVETGEKDGSTSESSLESSSGYGSQIITMEDAAHNEGYPSGTMRNSLLRRSSVQGHKPPPPIRRTSSISGRALSPVGGSMENLPPPPAFLLQDGCGNGDSGREKERAGSVAETVRTLTELRHQPASPVMPRRVPPSQRQSAPPATHLPQETTTTVATRAAPGRGGAAFLQALNDKLALQQQAAAQGQLRAGKVRQLIASRTVSDPTTCHESLMDQIRRGTTLRRTGTVNDRSAPRIR
ncbi:protein MTSS 2 isoform X4 [Schistocerca gregaria]|uniref:protein MTSS 2 isoform X4 n=1 Tax=Schistocerca gregaria TaxID=7010 RepID=UPI00211F40DC|nr:protein MTSS 2 isoform X4 [Schistocerca gregaria]